MFPQGVAHQRRSVSLRALGGLVGGVQQLFIQDNLNDLHMWNLFHSILHMEDRFKICSQIPVGWGGRDLRRFLALVNTSYQQKEQTC
jgi:hypothetical protein